MIPKRKIQDLVRKNIFTLEPYSSARDDYSGDAVVWLDANENPYPGQMRLVLRDLVTGEEQKVFEETGLNRYPDPYQKELKEKIARRKNIKAENVFLGNGSDEILDLLLRTFCEPQRDEVILLPPAYGMYSVLADIHGVKVKEVPLDTEMQPDVDRIMRKVTENTKLIFLCSPNNPTGNTIWKERVMALLENFDGLVVLDEAYIDFAPEKSLLSLIARYDKLVVLQTFSKARGLAGIRLGMAFASPGVFYWLNRVKLPYNLNSLTLALARLRFDDMSFQEKIVSGILRERKRLETFLLQHKEVKKVFPSEANFLLVCFKNPRRIYHYLLAKGIIVRERSRIPGCGKAIRITIGTESENDLLIKALQQYPGEEN